MDLKMVTESMETIEEEMQYQGKTVLKFKIEYPRFESARYKRATEKMNTYYKLRSQAFAAWCRTKLYRQAVEQFIYSKKNKYPIMVYEAVDGYTVTYNKECMVSLFNDRYIFSGGAHGNTTRTSNTWDLKSKRRVTAERFFPRGSNYKAYVQEEIIRQITEQMESGEDIYFDDYVDNVQENWDSKSYYLTPEGVVFYFQQYEIAPYSSGIPEFLLPFEKGKVLRPRC